MVMTLLLLGCEELDQIKETVDGVTNPLVAQGLILGVAEPEYEEIDLSDSDWANGALVKIFLADASSVDDMANAPVEGATVRLKVGDAAGVELLSEGGGAYAGNSEEQGISYVVGSDATVNIQLDGDASSISRKLPDSPQIADQVDYGHSAGTAINLDLSAQDFDSVLAVVLDTESGEVTWSNEPADIEAVYEFTHGDGQKRLEIPAKAFAAESIYAIGVAGMKTASTDDFDNVNTALSSFMVGQLRFVPTCTIPNCEFLDDLEDELTDTGQ